MAEEIVEGECRTVDLKKFKLSRFEKGELFSRGLWRQSRLAGRSRRRYRGYYLQG